MPHFNDFGSLVAFFIGYINLFIALLGAIAVAVFFWGAIGYIRASGDSHAKETGRDTMVWGLIAIVVLFSIGGIVELLRESFLSGTGLR